MNNSYIVTKEDIEQTFQIICKYSIHSFMDDIKKGFITISRSSVVFPHCGGEIIIVLFISVELLII